MSKYYRCKNKVFDLTKFTHFEIEPVDSPVMTHSINFYYYDKVMGVVLFESRKTAEWELEIIYDLLNK